MAGADGGDTGPLVVRPYRGIGLFCAAVLALSAAAQLPGALRQGSGGRLAAAGVALAAALLLAAQALVARVEWTGSTLRRHDLLRTRSVSRADVGHALLMTSLRRGGGAEPVPLLVVLDRAGRPVLRLAGGMWRDRELDQLARSVAGDAVERVDDTTDVEELERRFPAALTARERHRRGLRLVLLAYLVVVIGVDVVRWVS